MRSEETEHLVATQWRQIVDGLSGEARDILRRAATHASEFSDEFYDVMQRDPEAGAILNAHQVSERLRPAMTRWIEACLTHYEPEQITQMLALQRHLGNLHARVGVKIDVLLRSARNIKGSVIRTIAPDLAPDARQFEAIRGALRIVDLSLEAMSEQYSTAQRVAARTDEAYRNFALSMNLSLERERQRAALLDWQSDTLQSLMIGDEHRALQNLGESGYGLWVRHKASAMMAVGDTLNEITGAMDRIDGVLLPECARVAAVPGSPRLRDALRPLLGEVKRIGFLTDSMFEHLITLEQGRDALTQLLSQRFESTILTREIELSRTGERPFAVMLASVDRFRELRERYGENAGERILQHVASCLVAAVRAGDFVFRHGGEQFLVVCVERNEEEAREAAAVIRATIAAEHIAVGPGNRVQATASMGVAMHDGHPDYQRLIERANGALIAARAEGTDRCVFAGA